ncbi:MAG TPA: protein translocase subunit SecF, partial [Acidimicrobiia bacterium]|nr:protein translocase subunit SecF [Acidimicrobiia bacterium]
MSAWSRLIRGETTIDFVGRRRRWFAVSAVLLLLSVAGLAIRGINLG